MSARRATVCAAAVAAALFGAGPAAAATVTIACAAVGVEYRLCREGAEAWAATAGHRVELVQTPNNASERLALFQQLLASGSADVDVLQIDVVWPGMLGGFLLDLRPHVPEEEVARHLPATVESYTVSGELKALPWFADVGLLYYRRDLLELYGRRVPESWEDLAATARAVVEAAGDRRLVGYVFQGRAYEGLTCNALEWLASSGAGRILGEDGRVTFHNPRAAAALTRARGWIGDIAPKGVLGYGEEDARGVFQSGHAVFMRNWPYAWALANTPDSPVAGKVGIAPLPRAEGTNGAHVGTLGGAGLAVSSHSRHREAAADLVRHLTAPAEQARRAAEAGFNPTIPALYRDPALLQRVPVLAELEPILARAVARPAATAGAKYNQLSAIFWNAVHDTLAGRGTAEENLAQAERRLRRLHRAGRW